MTQPLAHHIASEVRAELARQRVTQSMAAGWLHIGQSQFNARLRGDVDFRPTELDCLAVRLGVPVTKFLPSEAAA